MGFLFFLAGYFVPPSYDRQGPGRFLRGRFVQLGIPSLLSMLVIHPCTVQSAAPVGGRFRCQPRWRHIWLTGAAIAILAFLIRTVQPIGTKVANMQLCFFAQYVILFALAAPALWMGMLLIFRTIPDSLRLLNGGWNLPGAMYASWESFYCVTISVGLVGLYRTYCNHRGKVEALLSDNSFGVYFIHPPILISVTLLMAPYGWPAVVKFAAAAAAAVIASYAAVSLVLRRMPLMCRIL